MNAKAPEVWFPNIGIEIQKLNRVLLRLGQFNIYWYGALIGLAFGLAFILIYKEAKRTNQNADDYLDFFIYMTIAGIVGARLYYVIFSWDLYKDNLLKIFATREGGMAIYGGIIAGTITGIIFTRVKKINLWRFGDTLIPALALGQAIGRWGNFFNREAFGSYTDSLFAMRYLKSQVPDAPPSLIEHIIVERGEQYYQVHPTFLYESLWNIALFVILTYISRRHKKFNGQILCLYFIGYGIGRFWIEAMRTDQLKLWGTDIAVSQVVSLLLAAGAAVVYYIRYKAYKQRITTADTGD